MEDWSGTIYGPTTHGPTTRRKPTPRTPGAATAPARPGPRKKAAVTSAEALPEPPETTSAEAPTSAPAAPALPPAAPERTALWARVLADPDVASEHLVRDAVRLLGPQARDWVDHTRERYPHVRPDALARLAAEEHVRTARRQAMANTTAVGSWVEVGLLSRTLASLVLTIAAVYGADPTVKARTRDLLELLPIPRITEPYLAAAGNVGRLLGAVAVRRVAARLMPFGAVVAGAIHSGRMAEDVAMQAIDRFRPKAMGRP